MQLVRAPGEHEQIYRERRRRLLRRTAGSAVVVLGSAKDQVDGQMVKKRWGLGKSFKKVVFIWMASGFGCFSSFYAFM